MSSITVWQDTGSSHARVSVQFDPTFDAVCNMLDYEAAQEAGIDLEGFDRFGVYRPEFMPQAFDAANVLAQRFRAMGG